MTEGRVDVRPGLPCPVLKVRPGAGHQAAELSPPAGDVGPTRRVVGRGKACPVVQELLGSLISSGVSYACPRPAGEAAGGQDGEEEANREQLGDVGAVGLKGA